MNNYTKGDRVMLFADFKDKTGAAANTTVTVTTLEPDGQVQTRSFTNPSTGRYESEFSLTGTDYKVGVWYYRIEGTGNVERAKEDWFEVEASKF